MKDKITALVFIALALFFLIGALRMPTTTEYGKYGSPGIVPVVFSVLVIILNLIMLLRKQKTTETISNDPEEKERNKKEMKRLLVSVATCLVYVLLLGHINFIVLTSIFTSALSLMFFRKKPALVIGASVLVTIGIYYLFEKLFLLPLP
ncbi:tripartite tricarboxylate transporter TctB family protein [Pseudothermotoga sp.]|uniref:tripartite tricarboxylate transporter TctB family protein n=1 Tax=Pseudothermotoga sp. TaxID=2033661 RepID=UPI00258DB93F|nr:tripartite tricarboxylate transporter TctB family protein [Pseudothermotoga sp.]MDK2883625.1 putative tricarboxylic transport rane protein [Pseudothermotoga sp.]